MTRDHHQRLSRSASDELMSVVIRHGIYPIWAWRDHPSFRRYLQEFQQTQYLSRNRLQQYQTGRLIKLLRHAYANCTFYRRRMDEAQFNPLQLESINQLSALPVLTKRNIQDFGSELVAANISPEERVKNQTGGSTGSPLQFFVDRRRFDSRMASTVRHDSWAGLQPGDWRAVLWGARLDQLFKKGLWDRLRNALLYRTIELNTSCIRDDDWIGFVSALRAKRPKTLVAYAQSAVLFAKYVIEQNLSDISFRAIITTAEVLMPQDRELLENTFRCKVFNRYGCREVSVIASECECHTGMHINAEALFVEIVPDPAIAAPAGRILVTDLLNYSMPLIRYEIGDIGILAPEQDCPCGRGLPLLAEVRGRTTDFLILPDGRRISGPALTLVVADMADVRQVQFVQRGRSRVVLRVVPGNNYSAQTVAELRKRLGVYLDQNTTLEVEEVESIASEVSGKYRFVINDMDADKELSAPTVKR
jgi:phenylacetate-CoA ligase